MFKKQLCKFIHFAINREKRNDVGLPEAKDPRVLYCGIRWRLVVSITLRLLYLWLLMVRMWFTYLLTPWSRALLQKLTGFAA